MKFKYLVNLSLFLLVLFSSCKEFIEPSISKKSVHLQAPVNKYQTSKYTINFWWDQVEDALAYRLQIVTPKFDSVEVLVLDTLVNSDKFSVTLEPGNYEWRVRAENGSTQTQYSTPGSFTILPGSLTEQIVTLKSPENQVITNLKKNTFVWNTLFGATKYRFQIDSHNFADTTALVHDEIIFGNELLLTLSKDTIYQWRVRAQNETEKSKWSDTRIITYDHTPPGIVTLLLPQNNEQIQSPFNFTWNAVPDAKKYKLYVFKSNGTTRYSPDFPREITGTSFEFKLGSSGESVLWKVSAIDEANNEGTASGLRTVIIE